MATGYKLLGKTDQIGHCDCCGREELQSTVKLQSPSGSLVFYGSGCAAKALGLKTSKAVWDSALYWRTMKRQSLEEREAELEAAAGAGHEIVLPTCEARGATGVVAEMREDTVVIMDLDKGRVEVPIYDVVGWKFLPRLNASKFTMNL